jgi:hypothetical protein
MKTTREFCPGNRYHYDSLLLGKGYAQVDTGQDASYFGTWANPETLVIFNYCEGDCATFACETAEEFLAELESLKAWNEKNGYSFGVDPGFKPEAKAKWKEAGAGHLLH